MGVVGPAGQGNVWRGQPVSVEAEACNSAVLPPQTSPVSRSRYDLQPRERPCSYRSFRSCSSPGNIRP